MANYTFDRYGIQYDDAKGVSHELIMRTETDTGPFEWVAGEMALTYDAKDSVLNPIKGKGLRVVLDASVDQNYEDLFSESERGYQVEYKRDGETLFFGWMNPEGWFEDWVSDRWEVSFDCIDGFGYLDNLSFVDNATGLPFRGKMTMLEVLFAALERSGVDQNIKVANNCYYTGCPTVETPFFYNTVNSLRYIKEDDETIMSCLEVLKEILEPVSCVIESRDGCWYIYRPPYLAYDQDQTFIEYDYNTHLQIGTEVVNVSAVLGSEVNGFYPHHCNENQSLTNKRSIGAFRINYDYGFAKSLIQNDEFFSADGATFDNWVITPATSSFVNTAGVNQYGLLLSPERNGEIFDEYNVWLTSDSLEIIPNIALNLEAHYSAQYYVSQPTSWFSIRLSIVTIGGVTWRYGYDRYEGELNWYADDPDIYLPFRTREGFGGGIVSYEIPGAPEGGTITAEIQTYWDGAADSGGIITVSKIALTNAQETPDDLKGEVWTFEKTDSPSSYVEPSKDVGTGDNIGDLYEGTIYKADGSTPTETWRNEGITGGIVDVPILEFMGQIVMNMGQSISKEFTGDIYGYIPYMGIVTIDGFEGQFMFISYDYNSASNIISCTLKQVFYENVDVTITNFHNYGNTTKPTIIG